MPLQSIKITAIRDGAVRRPVTDEGIREDFDACRANFASLGVGVGTVAAVVAGTGIAVNSVDPANPVVALSGAALASLASADSAVQPGSAAFTGTPTAPTASLGTNTTQLSTTAFVQTALTALVNSAPSTLDTLKELSDALGADANFATTTATALGNRALTATAFTAGTGLTGGGSLAADRTIALSSGSIASLALADTSVQPARAFTAGTGLTGGGSFAADRTIALSSGAIASLALADTSVQPARAITAGTGLTGGGSLAADRTLSVDQSFSPTMTGAWTFTNAVPITISSAEPRLLFNATGGGTNGKLFDLDFTPTLVSFRTRTDADGAGVNIFTATRTASSTAVTNLSLGNATNNPSFTLLGTGTFTTGGAINSGSTVTAPNVNVNAATLTGTGINRPGTNRLGFVSNSLLRGEFDANGKFVVNLGHLPDAGGLKHARVTTGSIGAGSTALVTVTWTTAFADANYTVCADVIDSTTSSLALSVVHVESVSASAVTVRVLNNAVSSLTGTLQVIAIHD